MLQRSTAAAIALLISCCTFTTVLTAQTTIINPGNATGTSGADGSFENPTSAFANNNWNVVNGTTNKWFVGTVSFCAGTKGAYISSHNAGNNTNYNNGVSDISHFYKDVTFPAGQSCITLSFNWKGQGESGWDGLRIYLGSTAVTPVAGTMFNSSDPTATQLGNNWYNLQPACGTATITIPATNAGTTKRLVFSWQNDGIDGTSPAITIDAISLVAQNPTIPTCATALVPANGATNIPVCNALTWTAPVVSGCNAAVEYDVYFGTSATPPLVGTTTSTTYSPIMNGSTTYYWQIRPKNSTGAAAGCGIQSFTTAASPNPQFTLVDNATSASPYNCVTLTPDLNSQRGCAWDINSTLNFLANFSYEMDINLGNDDAGADGMAFVMQNDPLGRCKCGTVGGALGAGGILNSVTVELDTYINYEDRDDFTPMIGCAGTEEPDHLDIWFNGNINPSTDANCDAVGAGERPATPNAVRLQSAPGVNYNIENGLNHKLRISWNAAMSTLTATVLNSALTITYGTISTTFNPITIFGTNTPYFGFTGSTGGLSNEQIFCLPAVLLPVDLANFEANCENDKAILRWETESERDNDRFVLDKSCNGIDFTHMADVKGAGTSQTAHSYALPDVQPCPGVNYYRLSQVDLNGNAKILGIRSVKTCDLPQEVFVYPNPATDQITVAWDGSFVESIVLTNALGQIISRSEVTHAQTTTDLDVSQLAAGIYYVTVQQQNGSQTVKVVVE